MVSTVLLSSTRWARVVVDSAAVYVERFRGPARARWTVRVGERGAVVIEPESYLDGSRSDFPLRSLRSVRVLHESRQRHAVVFDRGDGQVRVVCRNAEVAARIAARCSALGGRSTEGR